MRRYRLRLLLLLFLATLVLAIGCISNGSTSQTSPDKPNIILVITDDQGYGDLACHGNPYLKTPNLDRLHAESVRLTDFHVTSTCSPTRGALMTGHNTNRAGSWHTVGSREIVFAHETMFPEILQKNGYSTAMIGKWHLGDNHPFRPQDRGFEETFMHGGGGVGQSQDHWGNDYFDDTYFRNGTPEKVQGYCTDIWFDNAMEFIDRKTDEGKPFFCYLSTNAPHNPRYISDDYANQYKGQEKVLSPEFNGMITNIDDNMGRLMEHLEEKGIANNTILIFMTDNGTAGGFRTDREGNVIKGFNANMRGGKGSFYDGGHRVPFFIRWPEKGISGGVDIDELTAHVDVFPTLVDALDLKGAENLDFDGVSIFDLISGDKDSLESRVIITDTQRKMIPIKWLRCSTMKDKWRLLNGEELYDVSSDPGQRNDISGQHPELVEELRQAYEDWWTSIEPGFEVWPTFTLCHETEPKTVLTSVEMVIDTLRGHIWRQEHVRHQIENYRGKTGYYNVNALDDGVYKFTLMRYPPEANLTLHASAPPDEPTPNTNVVPFKAGLELPIETALIQIDDDQPVTGKVDPTKTGHSFEINLKKGAHKLRTDFILNEGSVYPAMYTVVEKVDKS